MHFFLSSFYYYLVQYFSDIFFYLRNIISAWNCVLATSNLYQAALAFYQTWITKLGKEIVLAQRYYTNDSNFQVNNSLISSSKIANKIFKITNTVCHLSSYMFNRKAASALFYSHIYYIKAFHEEILLDKFDSALPEDFSSTDCYTCIYYFQEKLKKEKEQKK